MNVFNNKYIVQENMARFFKQQKYIIAMMLFTIISIFSVNNIKAEESSTVTLNLKGEYVYSKAYQVLELVNKERKAEGLGKLKMDKDLMEAAMVRSAESALYFEHTRPNGEECFTIHNKAYGENIASGSNTAKGVMNQWMNSQGHKENILDGEYTSIGIGCFVIDGVTYWSQLFGINKADEPKKQSEDCSVFERIKVDTSYLDFYVWESLPLKVDVGDTITPILVNSNFGWENMYCKIDPSSFDWASSDTKIATVDATGMVKFVGEGTVVIMAKCKNTDYVVFMWSVKSSTAATVDQITKLKKVKPKIVSAKKKGRKVQFNIKKIKGAKFYQIKYGTNKKFKGAKTKTFKQNKFAIKKLKKGKKYFFKVRVCTYNEKGKKVYSKFSKVKKVKIK